MLDEAAREELAARIAERSFGLGPLEPLLADPEVDEMIVCGTGARLGRARRTPRARRTARFGSEAELRHAIERILAPLGRRVDEAEPLVDARLPDGSRVNVVVPRSRSRPGADDPALPPPRLRPEELVENGTLTAPLPSCSRAPCGARCNLLVCGGTGSGKTTTAQRAVELHRPRRAGRDDRGRGRAASAAAPRVRLERARRTSRAAARSRSAASSATRCGCGPTASSSARSAGPRRWTC